MLGGSVTDAQTTFASKFIGPIFNSSNVYQAPLWYLIPNNYYTILMKLIVAFWCHWPGAPTGRASGQTDGQPIKVCCRRRVAAVLKTSKPTQEPAQSGRGGDGRGGEGRG